MSSIIQKLLSWCWNWIVNNAVAKLYTSTVPVGKHLGGTDDPKLLDWYIILDIRAGGKILLLGYFQVR
jgi:hypothetical protein